VAICALLVAACGGDPGQPLATWELRTPGGAARAIAAPTWLPIADHTPGFVLARRVVIPEGWRGDGVTLSIPYWSAPATLLVDGEPVRSVVREDHGYRARGPQAWRIEPALARRGSLALELRAEHRWPQSAWLPTVPHLSRGDGVDRMTSLVVLINDRAAGAGLFVLLTIAFTAGSIFLLDRRQRAYGWMTLQFTTATYYLAFVTGHGQALLGSYDVAILCATVFACMFASVLESCEYFGVRSPPRWVVLASVGVVALTAAAVDPFLAGRWCAPMVAALGVPMILWQLALHVRMVRAGHLNARLRLVAWLGALLGAPGDSLVWFGVELFGGLRLLPLSYTLYGLIQFVALSRQLLLTLRRADRLNVELAVRMRHIEVLNVELRRQIAERSRQLTDALSRLSRGRGAVALPSGTVIDDRYRVVSRIGAGAMGTVYEVVRIVDDRRLAMKVLGNHDDPTRLARFAREAQLAAEIDHPNVVEVVDVDFASAGFMFIVMELVDGQTLRASRERFGERPWADQVLVAIADGLAAIHAHGIVHRDLKPDNVLLTAGGQVDVKILDFGVSGTAGAGSSATTTPAVDARADDDTHVDEADIATRTVPPPELTATGVVLGTPSYMAPEVAGGAEPAPSSDVFSLGLIAFELYTGRRPYVTAPASARLAGVEPQPLLRFADECRGLEPALIALLDRALALDPGQRPSAAEIAAALRCRAPGRRAPTRPRPGQPPVRAEDSSR
jgi:hypothetical protein